MGYIFFKNPDTTGLTGLFLQSCRSFPVLGQQFLTFHNIMTDHFTRWGSDLERLVSISGKKGNIGSQRAPKSSEPIGIASNPFLGLIVDGFMLRTIPQLRLSSEIDHFPSKNTYFSGKSRIRAWVPADSSGAEGLETPQLKNCIVRNSTLR